MRGAGRVRELRFKTRRTKIKRIARWKLQRLALRLLTQATDVNLVRVSAPALHDRGRRSCGHLFLSPLVEGDAGGEEIGLVEASGGMCRCHPTVDPSFTVHQLQREPVSISHSEM